MQIFTRSIKVLERFLTLLKSILLIFVNSYFCSVHNNKESCLATCRSWLLRYRNHILPAFQFSSACRASSYFLINLTLSVTNAIYLHHYYNMCAIHMQIWTSLFQNCIGGFLMTPQYPTKGCSKMSNFYNSLVQWILSYHLRGAFDRQRLTRWRPGFCFFVPSAFLLPDAGRGYYS